MHSHHIVGFALSRDERTYVKLRRLLLFNLMQPSIEHRANSELQ